jgi:pyruvate dehydrogenase E2 component (dihydrolipoamide acetyltransferase)
MATDFTLPELGENIAAGDVLRVLVKAGDILSKDQPVLELETDKATIEVPSSVTGQVKEIKVKAGDKVKVGQTILSVEGDDAAAAAAPAPAKAEEPPPSAPPEAPRAVPQDREKVVDFSRAVRPVSNEPVADGPAAPAAPSVRRMARELGVEIGEVAGTGDEGRISIEDVKAHAKRLVTTAKSTPAAGAAQGPLPGAVPLPDFSRWGPIERQPMRGVRRKTAEHLAAVWVSVPLVTQYDAADISGFEEVRKHHAKQTGESGVPLTVTALAIKIVAAALRKFPQFNVSIDMAAEEIIVKKYVHIGVAVDTDRGLLVPVIRDADSKSLLQVSSEVAELAAKARHRKLTLDEMQGATFSISNLGGIGGTNFTPLVNAPEVGILGISRARMEQVFKDGQFVARLMMPLALSYDHRAVDGADGARFLRWVAEVFEQPFLLSLQS